MNDTLRVLLVAAALSAAAVAALAWRITREDPTSPQRVVGELRLSRWVAVLLSALGAVAIGVAAAIPDASLANVEASCGVLMVGLAGIVLQREPPEGLLIATVGCAMYAAWNLAHRPGWLPDNGDMHWFRASSAVYAVCLGAVSYWARRR